MTTKKSIELENYSVQVRNFFSKMVNINGNIQDGSVYNLNEKDLESFKQFLKTIIGEEGSIQKTFDELMVGLDMEEKYDPFKKYHNVLKEMFAKNLYQLLKIDIEKKKSSLEEFVESYNDKSMNMEVFESSEGNVWKYVFTDDTVALETVLYKYNSFEERTVICCSVQSGCRIGCDFCGTGSKFIKSIDAQTIVYQIEKVLEDKGISDINSRCEKFQIMLMSMGEPMDNWDNVKEALRIMNRRYPNAQLLISTIGVKNDNVFKDLIDLSIEIDKIGLQFSIHKSTDEERNILIPYKKKYSLREIRDRGTAWQNATGRNVFLNYCVDENNARDSDIENLKNLFSPVTFNFTFSVICEAGQNPKEIACSNMDTIRNFENAFLNDGYNTRIFDPAGQDDISAGCGQLAFFREYAIKNK